jgi:KaiC/GvpD/RAD55 family RecA-like ATPase
MYRKEVHEKSPLRVFERSIHGGLGRGNVGLVISRAGEGKTAFLVDLALDDLMRDRKVVHVATGHSADHLREYYDEIFADLAETMQVEEKDRFRAQIQHNRMIHSFLHGSFDLSKVDSTIGYMKEHFAFEPYCVILDGAPDWEHGSPEDLEFELKAIKTMAARRNVELWLSASAHREEPRDEKGIPLRLKPFFDLVSVAIQLVPAADHIKLQLIKDHDSPAVAELHLELDPRTLLLRWE